MITYTGITDQSCALGSMKQLIEYANIGETSEKLEIQIIFEENGSPYCVRQIRVPLDDKNFDVFECALPFQTDVDAKLYAKSFAEELIKYRMSLVKHHNDRIK